MDEIQQNIYDKALKFRDGMITRVDSYDEFKRVLDEKGGFILAHWDGTPETESSDQGRDQGDHSLYSGECSGRGRCRYAFG